MISVRITPDEAENLDSIIWRVENNPILGIDLALYGRNNFPAASVLRFCDLHESKLSMHLNHYAYTGQSLLTMSSDAYRAFLRDVSFAHKINTRRAVLHWSDCTDWHIPPKRQITAVLSLFESKEILPYIENLNAEFDWQRRLIDVATQTGVPFGVCFDIGHAKLWGRKPIDAWIRWLDDLNEYGVSLMFHLHGNKGESDNHFPLWFGDGQFGGGYLGCDMTDVVRQLLVRYPKATFVLETEAKHAIQNIDWMKLTFTDELIEMRDVAESVLAAGHA